MTYEETLYAIQWKGENRPDSEFVFETFESAEHYLKKETIDREFSGTVIPLYRKILDTFVDKKTPHTLLAYNTNATDK